MRGWLALALVGCQQGAHKVNEAKELFDHPEWIGTTVAVDIDAPMLDDEYSSLADHGELDVEIKDVGANRLALARADHTPITMAGTIAPVHVVATLREAPHGLRLEATSIEHYARPAPIEIAKPSDILEDPAKFSGAMVTFEADWLVGFEASIIDRGIWMELFPDAKEICEPPPPPREAFASSHTYHVRVIGRAYTAGHYGHLSMAKGQITATEVTYLDPTRPECR